MPSTAPLATNAAAASFSRRETVAPPIRARGSTMKHTSLSRCTVRANSDRPTSAQADDRHLSLSAARRDNHRHSAAKTHSKTCELETKTLAYIGRLLAKAN